MTLAHHFLTMAWNNAWANHRLLAACARLTPAELAATRTSFFPSIRATLNHNLTVDGFYVDALERSLAAGVPARASSPAELTDGAAEDARRHDAEPFEALAAAQRAVDQRLIAVCAALTDADLDRTVEVPRRWGVQREPATRLLAHLFQHQIHHRGQAHAMLAGTALKPPQLDEFFSQGEAGLRADDLAELGTTEAAIWGPPADDRLHDAIARLRPAPDHARIALVVQRLRDEGRATPPEVVLDPVEGVVGDRWGLGRRDPGSQVTLMRWDVASLLSATPEDFGDNLFARIDTSDANLPPGTLVRVGEARCVVTPKPHTGCSKFQRRSSKAALALFGEPEWLAANLRGVHLRVLERGVVRVGDEIRVLERP